MHLAVDTPTCLRRTALMNPFSPTMVCDKLGDQVMFAISGLFVKVVIPTYTLGIIILQFSGFRKCWVKYKRIDKKIAETPARF
jgi:hypothetical protein